LIRYQISYEAVLQRHITVHQQDDLQAYFEYSQDIFIISHHKADKKTDPMGLTHDDFF